MQKTSLVAGITGQDGAYLAHHLLKLGYKVVGTSRDAHTCDLTRLERLGIKHDVELISLALNDFRSVLKGITSVEPDEIYNLAGQTSVGLSFEQPVECMESIAGGILNILEASRYFNASIRIFNAGSSECFGDTGKLKANENSSFKPRSPYAVAKSTAFWQVANYRDAYNMKCCTGILANHESPLRPNRFVTMKIINGVKMIKRGEACKLILGNLDIYRDWGWAPEYVTAMHKMLQSETPKDYLIASGNTISLRQFVEIAFEEAGLNPNEYLESDRKLLRPNDLSYSGMNPTLINNELSWKATTTPDNIVRNMMNGILF